MAIQRAPVNAIEVGRAYFFEDTEFPIKVTDVECVLVHGLLKQPGKETPVVVTHRQLRKPVHDVVEIACILKAVAAEFDVSEEEGLIFQRRLNEETIDLDLIDGQFRKIGQG